MAQLVHTLTVYVKPFYLFPQLSYLTHYVMIQMSFKIFLIWSSGGPPARRSGTIYAILKEGIMGNIHVKFYEIWINGSEGDVL